ncbi:MAG: glutamate--tRNA ligase [Bacteroidota bacterium]
MSQTVRVRFAPSPTGPLHIGGVRTALYNYLLAKKHQGRFILRLEDTDQARFVPGAEQYIIDTLQWLGIAADEGPSQGGPQGPYRQSARKKIYPAYVARLVEAGKAYYAFDTPQELAAMRDRLQAARVASPQYNAISREWMKNSLTLPQQEVAARLEAGVPHAIRIKVPHQKTIRFYDQVRGWVRVQSATLDDKVLMKADGTPTYHLASVVDDYLMQTTHVIRGEEWLPSTPIHVLLYQYLGLEQAMPQFVHLPLLLKPEGYGKLSKRQADHQGFPIFPIAWQDPDTGTYIPGFREQGYLPEALLNFLALLGWSPAGGGKELLSREELIQAFSIERIHKAGVKLDIQKAAWFNQQYLRAKPEAERVRYLTAALDKHHIAYTPQQARQICQLIQERAVFPQDFWEQGKYFFQAPETYDVPILKGKWNKQVHEVLQAWIAVLRAIDVFQAPEIKTTLARLLEARQMKHKQVMPVIRVALTGIGVGPDLMQTMEVMGQQEAIKRLIQGLAQFEKAKDLAI